jgi:hypothetical protein
MADPAGHASEEFRGYYEFSLSSGRELSRTPVLIHRFDANQYARQDFPGKNRRCCLLPRIPKARLTARQQSQQLSLET